MLFSNGTHDHPPRRAHSRQASQNVLILPPPCLRRSFSLRGHGLTLRRLTRVHPIIRMACFPLPHIPSLHKSFRMAIIRKTAGTMNQERLLMQTHSHIHHGTRRVRISSVSGGRRLRPSPGSAAQSSSLRTMSPIRIARDTSSLSTTSKSHSSSRTTSNRSPRLLRKLSKTPTRRYHLAASQHRKRS